MRTFVSVLCVACMLACLGGAASANADGSSFFLQFKAGWGSGIAGDETVQNTTASFGAAPVSATSNLSLGPSSYNLALTDAIGEAWLTQKYEGLSSGEYSFTLVVAPGTHQVVSNHIGGTHENNVYISAWNLDFWAGATGYTLADNYLVTVSKGSTQLAQWTKADLFLSAAPGVTVTGPVGFWYDYGGHHYETFADAIADGNMFTVTVASTPEPGSLLALGGGLFGMAGFALRRRKAQFK